MYCSQKKKVNQMSAKQLSACNLDHYENDTFSGSEQFDPRLFMQPHITGKFSVKILPVQEPVDDLVHLLKLTFIDYEEYNEWREWLYNHLDYENDFYIVDISSVVLVNDKALAIIKDHWVI